MYLLRKKTLTLFSILTLFMMNGCSSHHEILSVSEPHLYNSNYGMIQNREADEMLRQEIVAMQNQVMEVEVPQRYLDQGTFLVEDYVETPDVISYKYKFDPKFYSKATWRTLE